MSFEAQELIDQAIKRHGDKIAVHWSGGRDSTCVLHIAILNRWRYDSETESLSDALRRMDRKLKEHGETGVRE